jgi:hypothetical protein
MEEMELLKQIAALKDSLADTVYERDLAYRRYEGLERDLADMIVERDQFRIHNEYLEDKIHDIKIQLGGI